MKYVAIYPVRTVVNGEKKVFKAGETVTELSDSDIKELFVSGVIESVSETIADAPAVPAKPKTTKE